jgi:hypothetical protein
MTHILVERKFEPGLDHNSMRKLLDKSGSCFAEWGVEWHGSYKGHQGKKILCHFEAADVESVRIAMRQSGTEYDARVHPVSNHLGESDLPINVVVERDFDEPVMFDAIQKMEEDGAWCLDLHKVIFVKTHFSLDRKHMICLYHAPDAESARIAQRQANMPVSLVWSCEQLLPEQFSL